jgi:hypothetical protein
LSQRGNVQKSNISAKSKSVFQNYRVTDEGLKATEAFQREHPAFPTRRFLQIFLFLFLPTRYRSKDQTGIPRCKTVDKNKIKLLPGYSITISAQ